MKCGTASLLGHPLQLRDRVLRAAHCRLELVDRFRRDMELADPVMIQDSPPEAVHGADARPAVCHYSM
jgi:hypothetical protein